MLTDKQKISLLATIWMACILTTLSRSKSFYAGYNGIAHVPHPPLSTVCKIPHQQERDCTNTSSSRSSSSSEEDNSDGGSKGGGGNSRTTTRKDRERQHESTTAATVSKRASSSTCRERVSLQVRRCERAAERAYAWIYMGGCPFQIQANTICRMEWCGGGVGNKEVCERECKVVKDKLDLCIRTHVDAYFGREGLNADGTMK